MRANLLALLLFLSPTVAFANNHDTGEPVPYCGDVEDTPICRVWDGDIEARPDPAPQPRRRCHVYDTDLNCFQYGAWDTPPTGAELLLLSRLANDSGDAVAVQCKTHFCAGSKTPWTADWWNRNHDSAPGQDEDRPEREVAERSEPPSRTDPPARAEPPARSEPPARQDPPRCD